MPFSTLTAVAFHFVFSSLYSIRSMLVTFDAYTNAVDRINRIHDG